MRPCDKCHSPSIIYQKYSGMRLCASHFDQDVHRKVRESLRKTNLFGQGSRLGLAISGGINSSTLLYILKSLFGCRRDIDFRAIIVDEMDDCNHHLQAMNLAEGLGIPYIIKKLPITDRLRQEDDLTKHHACFASKMEIINRATEDIGADILAMGHNLDDEATRIFLNYIKGDCNGHFHIQRHQKSSGKIPCIKPLQRIPEKEVRLYAINHGLYSPKSDKFVHKKTAYSVAKRLLNDFDSRHPGTKYSLLAGLEKINRIRERTNIGANTPRL